MGGAVGVALAAGAVRLLVRVGPATLPRLHEVRLDAASSFVHRSPLSLVAAVAFGTMPLWRAPRLAASLHDRGRSNTASRGRHRARHLLMAGQVALALVLLVASGLMVRSFQRLRAIDPGFNATNALTFTYRITGSEVPLTAGGGRRASRDPRPARGGAWRDRSVRLHVSAARGRVLWQHDARGGEARRHQERSRHSAPSARWPQASSTQWGCASFAGAASRATTSSGASASRWWTTCSQSGIFPDRDPIGQRIASNRPPARPGELPAVDWLTIVGVVASTPVRTLVDPASSRPGVHADVNRGRSRYPCRDPWWDRTCRP